MNIEVGREVYANYNQVLSGLVNMISNPSPRFEKSLISPALSAFSKIALLAIVVDIAFLTAKLLCSRTLCSIQLEVLHESSSLQYKSL